MQFVHIKSEQCGVCGAPPVRDEFRVGVDGQILHHVNGQRREVRSFTCGTVIEWEPCFQRIETTRACPLTPERQLRDKQFAAAVVELRAVVEKSPLHQGDRERLLSAVDSFKHMWRPQ